MAGATFDSSQLQAQWVNGLRICHIAHSLAMSHYNRLRILVGVPVTVFSVLIGTSIFTTLASSENRTVLILVGICSVVSAILSGLQTFLNYPELVQRHHSARIRYGSLRRQLEEFLSAQPDPPALQKFLSEIRVKWDQIDSEAPVLLQRFHDRARRQVKPDSAASR